VLLVDAADVEMLEVGHHRAKSRWAFVFLVVLKREWWWCRGAGRGLRFTKVLHYPIYFQYDLILTRLFLKI
jgi:hypothetical protein